MDWNASLYGERHSFVWKLGEGLIDLLAPQPGERILDVGCGTGELTKKLAEKGALVTGLDKSGAMLEQARIICPEGTFIEGDLLDFTTEQPFDAIFSNAALHWVQPAERAAERMFAALRPGGRLVAEFGGSGNTATLLATMREILEGVVPLVRQIWYFPTLGEYSKLLESAGFEVLFCRLFDRPTELDGGERGLQNWLQMFGRPILESYEPGAADKVAEAARDKMYRDGVWRMDYRRLRVVAQRPGKTAESGPGSNVSKTD